MDSKLTYALDAVRCDALEKFNPQEDISKIADAAATIIVMGNVARSEGLLALEVRFPQYAKELAHDSIVVYDNEIEAAVNYVVDGMDPANIEEMLINRYWVNRYQGNDALECYIIIRGILLVQAGANPRIMEEWIKSLLPEVTHEKIGEYLSQHSKKWNEDRTAEILKRYEEWTPIQLQDEEGQKKVQLLEEKVFSLTDDDWFKVQMNMEREDLAMCMAVFSETGRERILEQMSEDRQVYEKNIMAGLTLRHKEKITKAIDKMLYAIWYEETGGIEARLKEVGLWNAIAKAVERGNEDGN